MKAKLEKKIQKDGLTEKIKAVLVPKERVKEVKKGQEKIVEKKLLPGYLLIDMELTDDTWLYMKKIGGLGNFIGNVKPRAITEQEIQKFLQKQQTEEPKVKVEFKKGDIVRIKEGPFENIEATVEELISDKGMIKVVAIVFGRPTPVEIEYWQVEKI